MPLSPGANRTWVRLSRRMAQDGFYAVRFDYHGIGESSGFADEFRLDAPFVQDGNSMANWVARNAASQLVLVGSCFGARTALACAAANDRVKGLVMIAPPVRDYRMGERTATRFAMDMRLRDYARKAFTPKVILGVFDAKKRRAYGKVAQAKFRALRAARQGQPSNGDGWASPIFTREVQQVLERGVDTLILLGTADEDYEEMQWALDGRLGEVFARHPHRVKVEALPGRIHGFPRLEAQGEVIEVVGNWVRERRFAWSGLEVGSA